jgi:hypothetical protein
LPGFYFAPPKAAKRAKFRVFAPQPAMRRAHEIKERG